MKKTLFLVLSSCIVVFSIVAICTAPIINGVLKEAITENPIALPWNILNCKHASDYYKKEKDDPNSSEEDIEEAKKEKNQCYRRKAMYGLEYSSLILDILLGFVCAVLGLLHYFDVGKPFEKITGIIGLSAGVITFILTLVYVCYSGYIFTKDIPNYYFIDGSPYKLNKDGAFAEKDGNKFKCLYYKDNDDDSILHRFSDLGKKQYNYEKKRIIEPDTKYSNCIGTPSVATCSAGIAIPSNCNDDYLYLGTKPTTFKNKYLFDMWVTTIIFTVLICVCAIGLAIFGFLLFKSSDGSGL